MGHSSIRFYICVSFLFLRVHFFFLIFFFFFYSISDFFPFLLGIPSCDAHGMMWLVGLFI